MVPRSLYAGITRTDASQGSSDHDDVTPPGQGARRLASLPRTWPRSHRSEVNQRGDESTNGGRTLPCRKRLSKRKGF